MKTFETINRTIRDFQSPITEQGISELLQEDRIELIRPYAGYLPSEQDLHLLNSFFKLRPEVAFRVTAPGMLRLLPRPKIALLLKK